jgi:hypothetical protein
MKPKSLNQIKPDVLAANARDLPIPLSTPVAVRKSLDGKSNHHLRPSAKSADHPGSRLSSQTLVLQHFGQTCEAAINPNQLESRVINRFRHKKIIPFFPATPQIIQQIHKKTPWK